MDVKNKALSMPVKNESSQFSDMRLAHFCIRTKNYNDIINWYIEKLDFRVVIKYNVGEMLLAFLAPAADDNFLIEIIGSNQEAKSYAQPFNTDHGLQHFCMDVDSVDATLAKLNARGVETYRQPFNVPPIGKRCGFIAHPWGNVIEFTENLK